MPILCLQLFMSVGISHLYQTFGLSFPDCRYFNEKSGISEHIPLGSFNAMFNFTGSWQVDAAATKSLAMVGKFIPRLNLVLCEEIRRAVPYSWDPSSLAMQHQSSPLSVMDIEDYVKEIGDQRFLDSNSHLNAGPLKYKISLKTSQHFQPVAYTSDFDVTVIFRRRGGDDLEQSHAKWAETVQLAPDVINMTFTPIVSLLEGVPGIKHLARAIDYTSSCMDGDFAPMVELVKVCKNAYTQLSNSKTSKELKAKMPLLDEKYVMEPEEVGHELLLYSRVSSSSVEILENGVLLEPSKKGRCWNELKSRGMLKLGKRNKVQFLRNDETEKLLKKQ
ncbi:hypothetical protein Pint_10186 [Pistacia integerrima]|uniref:Uncharacterized protein n=1 Tax=Pistacia integerrima TaxID=434235 RepID=A0ACC0XID9_9ROSI|nr:hypothetical protein Pint_10186 [Pistacia integerrima]